MKKIINRKGVKAAALLVAFIAVGVLSILGYRLFQPEQSRDSTSTLASAIENLYGEWEIVEDLGFHGIGRSVQEYFFEVGDTFVFDGYRLYYEGNYDVEYRDLYINRTESAEMQQFDRMEYPHHMGFDSGKFYVQVRVHDRNNYTSPDFYVLSDSELILESDPSHYFRAMKKGQE